ncbi:MAG: aldehyde dehydrogenase family protein, partial [Verrucomicrobiae bacterium]|nr:aldehyde dehydrogenase family protein [Verrucomicrobiae bacterium]
MTTPINETLIRDIIEEVLERLGSTAVASSTPQPSAQPSTTRPPSPPCPCTEPPHDQKTTSTSRAARRGTFGVFHDANEACEAAHEAYLQLSEKGVAGRNAVVRLIKDICSARAVEWGKLELDETKIGRLDHKIEKLQGLQHVPGVEFLNPYGLSGDHGITLEEYAPFGVIGAVTPSTHSIPTMACNIISMVAAGNAVVFNAHPAAYRCAVTAARVFNEAIY